MNIDWEKIKEKYTKAFSLFEKTNAFIHNKIILGIDDDENTGACYPCYCDLEKFFYNNGMIITINYVEDYKFFIFKIYNMNNDFINYSSVFEYQSRHLEKIENQAILKAFEIFEITKEVKL
jgi:hypothetical protein